MLVHLLTIAPLEIFVLLRNTKPDYVQSGRWAGVHLTYVLCYKIYGRVSG